LKCQEWFVPFLQFIEGLFRLSRISACSLAAAPFPQQSLP
jgi:hypothetical protein